MSSRTQRSDADEGRAVPARFRHLPERVDPSTWVEELPSEDPEDPEAGRDTDRDFMLRNAGA